MVDLLRFMVVSLAGLTSITTNKGFYICITKYLFHEIRNAKALIIQDDSGTDIAQANYQKRARAPCTQRLGLAH